RASTSCKDVRASIPAKASVTPWSPRKATSSTSRRTKSTSKRTPAPTNRSSSCSPATAQRPSSTTLATVTRARPTRRNAALPESVDEDSLNDFKYENGDHRREVDHPEPRHDPSDRIENRLGDRVQRLHQRAPRIHVEPAQDRPHEDRNDQQGEHHADDLRDRRIASLTAESEHYAPSSRERSYAASIASMIAPLTPAFSTAMRPAAGVPA